MCRSKFVFPMFCLIFCASVGCQQDDAQQNTQDMLTSCDSDAPNCPGDERCNPFFNLCGAPCTQTGNECSTTRFCDVLPENPSCMPKLDANEVCFSSVECQDSLECSPVLAVPLSSTEALSIAGTCSKPCTASADPSCEDGEVCGVLYATQFTVDDLEALNPQSCSTNDSTACLRLCDTTSNTCVIPEASCRQTCVVKEDCPQRFDCTAVDFVDQITSTNTCDTDADCVTGFRCIPSFFGDKRQCVRTCGAGAEECDEGFECTGGVCNQAIFGCTPESL